MRRFAAGVVLVLALGTAAPALGQADATDLFRLGAQELASGLVDKAIETFERAVQLKGDAKEGWYNLGVAYGRKKLYQKEILAYQKALELDPNYANALHNLGLAYLDLGQRDKAIDSLGKASKVDPNATDAWNNLGVALLEKGEPVLAIDALRKATAAAPGSAEAQLNLGIALMRAAEKETGTARRDPILREAIKANEDALAADPKYFRACYNKAILHHRLGEFDSELAAYRQALAIKPDYAAALYNIAAILSGRDDKAAAIKAWDDYLKVGMQEQVERPFVENARRELARLRGQ